MQNSDLELSVSKVNMMDFLEKLWGTSKILIGKKFLKGRMYVHKNMPENLKLDPIRVMQIVYNLVSNAVKFTQSGYVAIICSWVDSEFLEDMAIRPTKEDLFRQILNREFSTSQKSSATSSPAISNLRRVDAFDECVYTEGFSKYLTSYGVNRISSVDFIGNYRKLDFDNTFVSPNEPTIKIMKTKMCDFVGECMNQRNRHGYLKIEVIDSGCGLASNQLQRLFHKFSQLGNNSQRQLGTGLGLWISQNLSRKMQGELKAFSKEQVVSVFVAMLKCEVVGTDKI